MHDPSFNNLISIARSRIQSLARTSCMVLDANPVVGYNLRKRGVVLLFWSGQSFEEPLLKASGSFKAAEYMLASMTNMPTGELKRWLSKARDIQWDYKNLVKRKGELLRLK